MAQLEINKSGAVEDEDGVLLYYKFAQINDPEETKNWLFDLCTSLDLLGRIRVAPDGINITVGGKMAALQEHIKVVASNPLFEGTDFKVASCTPPVNPKAAAECGFTSLSARTVNELVTLGLHPAIQPPSVSNAGRHATAQEFHEILQEYVHSAAQERTGAPRKQTVVVDARNLYETRIGKFRAPQGIEVMDPLVRQYSDLPGWIDEHEDQLRDKRILMYCTGGVRCEMASAYIRSKGNAFEDVVQLSGGIQRYMEAFPDGGYFVGKNFVFDHRLAVPSSNQEVLGSCLLCDTPFDDYSARCRCSLCRMLVLVCNGCQVAAEQSGGPPYICEVCNNSKTLKASRKVRSQGSLQREESTGIHEHKASVPDSKDENQADRKLRLLCLHGFRQNATKMKGRLNALRKKLRDKVELVYVDAPHDVPPYDQQYEMDHQLPNGNVTTPTSICCSRGDAPAYEAPYFSASQKVCKKFAWLLSPERISCDAPNEIESQKVISGSKRFETQPGPSAACGPSLEQSLNGKSFPLSEAEPKWPLTGTSISGAAPEPYVLQHRTQTLGWSKSWRYLQTVFADMGPFDGVLGFSQGAAIAAALCLSSMSNTNELSEEVKFKFVVLCSGFRSPAVEHCEVMSMLKEGAIDVPSLHVFGGCEGNDRQITVNESEQLAALFSPEKRHIVRHQSGHIIPTQPEYVQQYLRFFEQF